VNTLGGFVFANAGFPYSVVLDVRAATCGLCQTFIIVRRPTSTMKGVKISVTDLE
jgi:hypothetical protein